ncbi:hypothetical protein OIO90_004969 [Microbotryomycetes sp. JL221]|nr:hypothetical protein OIO90_004969 [Microbotryomycetes sp. JL221]
MSSQGDDVPQLSETPSSPSLRSTQPSPQLGLPERRFNPFLPVLPSASSRRPFVRKPFDSLTDEERAHLKRPPRQPMNFLGNDIDDDESVVSDLAGDQNNLFTEFVVGVRKSSVRVGVQKPKRTNTDEPSKDISEGVQKLHVSVGDTATGTMTVAQENGMDERTLASDTTSTAQTLSVSEPFMATTLSDWDSQSATSHSTNQNSSHMSSSVVLPPRSTPSWKDQPAATPSSWGINEFELQSEHELNEWDWEAPIQMQSDPVRPWHWQQLSGGFHAHQPEFSSRALSNPSGQHAHGSHSHAAQLHSYREHQGEQAVEMERSNTQTTNSSNQTAVESQQWNQHQRKPDSTLLTIDPMTSQPKVSTSPATTVWQHGLIIPEQLATATTLPPTPIKHTKKRFVYFKNRRTLIVVPSEHGTSKRTPLQAAVSAHLWQTMFENESDCAEEGENREDDQTRLVHPDELRLPRMPPFLEICLSSQAGWGDVWDELMSQLWQPRHAAPQSVHHVKSNKPVVSQSHEEFEDHSSRRASITTSRSTPQASLILTPACAALLDNPIHPNEFIHAPTPHRPLSAVGGWLIRDSSPSSVDPCQVSLPSSSPEHGTTSSTDAQAHQTMTTIPSMTELNRNFGPDRDRVVEIELSFTPPPSDLEPSEGNPNEQDQAVQSIMKLEELRFNVALQRTPTKRRLHGPRPLHLDPSSTASVSTDNVIEDISLNSSPSPVRVLRAMNPDRVPFSPTVVPESLIPNKPNLTIRTSFEQSNLSHSSTQRQSNLPRVVSAPNLMKHGLDSTNQHRLLSNVPGQDQAMISAPRISTPRANRSLERPQPQEDKLVRGEDRSDRAEDENEMAHTLEASFSIQNQQVEEHSNTEELLSIDVGKSSEHTFQAQWSRELAELRTEVMQSRQIAQQAIDMLQSISTKSTIEQEAVELLSTLEKRIVIQPETIKLVREEIAKGVKIIESVLSTQLQNLVNETRSFAVPVDSSQPFSNETAILKNELDDTLARLDVSRASELSLVNQFAESQNKVTTLERDLYHVTRELDTLVTHRDKLTNQVDTLMLNNKTTFMELKALQVEMNSFEKVLTFEKETYALTRGEVVALEKRILNLDNQLHIAMKEKGALENLLEQALTKAAKVDQLEIELELAQSSMSKLQRDNEELNQRLRLKNEQSIESMRSDKTISVQPSIIPRDTATKVTELQDVTIAQDDHVGIVDNKEHDMVDGPEDENIRTVDHFDLSPTPSETQFQQDEQGWWSQKS